MIKEKFIIINSENKILVFFNEQKATPVLFLPGVVLEDNQEKADVTSLFVNNDTREDYELISELTSENSHLSDNKIKRYYAKYEELSKEKISQIINYCYDNNLTPHFLSPNQIIGIITNKKLKIHRNSDMVKVLIKLRNDYNIR